MPPSGARGDRTVVLASRRRPEPWSAASSGFIVINAAPSQIDQNGMNLDSEPPAKNLQAAITRPQVRVCIPSLQLQFEKLCIVLAQPPLEGLRVVSHAVINQIDRSLLVDSVRRDFAIPGA
jgi:hypothetical protein